MLLLPFYTFSILCQSSYYSLFPRKNILIVKSNDAPITLLLVVLQSSYYSLFIIPSYFFSCFASFAASFAAFFAPFGTLTSQYKTKAMKILKTIKTQRSPKLRHLLS